MRILVCFKVLPVFENVLDADWDDFTLQSDISYAKRALNCFDESALEIALQLREALLEKGEPAFCAAVTAGPAPPAFVRKLLFAVGFDQIQVLENNYLEFQSNKTAAVLAEFAREGAYDLILTGKQAGYADTGTVPLLLAEALGLSAVTEVETVELHELGFALTRATDFGRERLVVRPPILASIGNSPAAVLRPATLRAQLLAAKREMDVRQVPGGAGVSVQLRREQHRRAGEMLSGEDVQELAQALYDFCKGM